MIVQSVFFYLFSVMTVISAFLVIIAFNSVYSVFFLIFSFLNAAGLFLLLKAEFIAMITVIVYVGAIVVLFLFVVMMLDIDVEEANPIIKRSFIGAFFIGVFAIEMVIAASNLMVFGVDGDMSKLVVSTGNNTEYIGMILYTNYAYHLEIAGFILLLAMIGAIVLTLRHRRGFKRQDVSKQLKSNPENSVTMVKVKSGKGI